MRTGAARRSASAATSAPASSAPPPAQISGRSAAFWKRDSSNVAVAHVQFAVDLIAFVAQLEAQWGNQRIVSPKAADELRQLRLRGEQLFGRPRDD